mmetsp:Transcript_8937/g.12300  ORF Transcript_8937/g.12300 Transcript_8937/m.12300 type:complete len:80 (+) Transcript_8937:467-706(+)
MCVLVAFAFVCVCACVCVYACTLGSRRGTQGGRCGERNGALVPEDARLGSEHARRELHELIVVEGLGGTTTITSKTGLV